MDEMRPPGQKAIFHNVMPIAGFHDPERDIWGPFVWSEKCFRIRLATDLGPLAVKLCYYGERTPLVIRGSETGKTEILLYRGWYTYPIDLSGLRGADLIFEVGRLIDVPGDARELGMMIRWIKPLGKGCSCDQLTRVLQNKVLNESEFAQGQSLLKSFPTKLRINTATECSMDAYCAYCDWDRTKDDERRSDFKFDMKTLEELGSFYALADEIVDNSYGEPLLYSHFGAFVDAFDRTFKSFEAGTNGLLLNAENRKKLLGKDVLLYVSADASTAEGFSRYRKADFQQLIDSLRELCQERQAHHELPKVIMSFIAMKSTVSDLGPFLDLMNEVGVDGTKVIYLDPDSYLRTKIVDRDGFSFDYDAELLSWPELEALKTRVRELAREKGTTVITRMDFGEEEAACGGPLCSDPWKNIHVLERGVVACLFSRNTPVAYWSERGDRTVEQFLADVWNGERYREIREKLSSGTLADLCKQSLSCPLVRKRMESDGE